MGWSVWKPNWCLITRPAAFSKKKRHILLWSTQLQSRVWGENPAETFWRQRKHLVFCFAFLSHPLACCAQLNTNTHYPLFVAWALAARRFSSCPSTGQRKKWRANKQRWKWPNSTGLKCLSLPCVLFFLLTSPWLNGHQKCSTNKAAPAEYRASVCRGELMPWQIESYLFVPALFANKRTHYWHMAVKLPTAGYHCARPPITNSPYPGERRTI